MNSHTCPPLSSRAFLPGDPPRKTPKGSSRFTAEHDETIAAICERLRGGADREESFRLLFGRFYWPLFRFFEHRGFAFEECRDLIQETFLHVHRGIRDFRGDAGWEHWLFRIAANTAVKAVRHDGAAKRAGRTISWEEEKDLEVLPPNGNPPDAKAPVPLRRLLDKERKDLLCHAIAGLPAQMRRCVRLRVFQDLDYDEIATALRISPSTVKVQLFKARKRLKIELEDSLSHLE